MQSAFTKKNNTMHNLKKNIFLYYVLIQVQLFCFLIWYHYY